MRKTELTSMFNNWIKSAFPWKNAVNSRSVQLVRASLVLFLAFSWAQNSTAQCTLSCNQAAQVSLPGPVADCEANVTHDMVLTSSLAVCPGSKEVYIYNSAGTLLPQRTWTDASSVTHVGTLVDETFEGLTLTVNVKDNATGNECWGAIKVEDKLGPSITNCRDTTLYCIQDSRPVSEGGEVIDPDFDDCMGASTLIISYVDQITNGTCSDPFSSLIRRTWRATDTNGNVETCVQTITLDKVTLASVTPICPTNVSLDCVNPNSHPSIEPEDTGYPTVMIGTTTVDVVPGASAFCSLAASYTDEEYELCGIGRKILRTWTIYDWCTPIGPGNPWSCIQVIKFEDATAPTILGDPCAAPLEAITSSHVCSADVTVPPIRTRDCSDVSVKISSNFGVINANGGVLENVPYGTHYINYIATDDCGNSTTCTRQVNVTDNVPPVAVCDEFTVVSLTSDGTGIANASTFDEGSSDNCEIGKMEVRRMPDNCQDTTYFDSYASFECCDLGDTVQVIFRVFDKAGNYNECMVEVEVQDKLAPVISCPPGKTVDCSADLFNLTRFGTATATDNCDVLDVEVIDERNVDNCGVGTIDRIFTAEDTDGRTAECTQVITVTNSDVFTRDDIEWPLDYTTDICGASTDPDDIPCDSLLYCRPELATSNCGLLAVTYTDQNLPVNNSCVKILRRWTVIDWCQYDPNGSYIEGYWEYTQTIKVADHDAPVLTCAMDTIGIDNITASCVEFPVTIPPVSASDCSNDLDYEIRLDYGNNGRIDSITTGNNASGLYPNGYTRVMFVVNDGCGNSSFCEVIVYVIDRKKPTPVCFNGLSATLMPTPSGHGRVTLTPMMFNNKSFDNCTPEDKLKFKLIPATFECTELGVQLVRMEVTDLAGNMDFCETFVDIQDNMGVCGGTTLRIGGGIKDEMSEGVENVKVDLNISGSFLNSYSTDAAGNYMFENLPVGNDYTVTPSLNSDVANGVSTFDLVLMSKHILNVSSLDSPYKMIAADANRSGSITTLDLVAVRKIILRVSNDFPNNSSWRFVDKNFVFSNSANPFMAPFPEVMNYNNLASPMDISDFIGIKVGDVNNDATPNAMLGIDDRTFNGTMTFATAEQTFNAGQTIAVPFTADDFSRIIGYQFTMNFDTDALQLVDIQKGELEGLSESNFGLTMANDGIITTSWDNSKTTLNGKTGELFTLHFQTKAAGTLSELLNISSQYTAAEAYAELDGSDLESREVTLRFNETATNGNDFVLYQNTPNPFSQNTTIGFVMPEAGEATLTVFDLSGKVINVVNEEYAKGHNQIVIGKNDFAATGVLYYRLETAGHTATRKMILVK